MNKELEMFKQLLISKWFDDIGYGYESAEELIEEIEREMKAEDK